LSQIGAILDRNLKKSSDILAHEEKNYFLEHAEIPAA